MKLGIVSGGNPPRYRSHINHHAYALQHGLDYHHDETAYLNLQTPKFHKLQAIAIILPKYDWVLWMDDDAFFTDFEQFIGEFLLGLDSSVFFVACKSPINPQGGWTFLNSGVFFVKNSPTAFHLLSEADIVPKSIVETWWEHDKVGLRTDGEQLHIIYVLHRDGLMPFVKLHEYAAFNARPYHYRDRIDQFRIVHFAGVQDREEAIAAFGSRFGLDDTLVPPHILNRCSVRSVSAS